MHLETRLWRFTEGVRGRIFFSMIIGLLAAGLGVARLALLGWLIGRVFAGDTLSQLTAPIVAIGGVMILRGVFEHWRTMVAHKTAAQVQKHLRRTLFDRIAALGPAYVGKQRSGALTLSLVDGVEQLPVPAAVDGFVPDPDLHLCLRGLDRSAGGGCSVRFRHDRAVPSCRLAQL